jgi:SPP1 family predicted phage head-tail adaptor
MRAGLLRHPVIVQTPTRTPTADGYTDSWGTVASVWASVQPATPERLERFVGATVRTPITHLVTMRYRGDLSAKHRLLFGSRQLYVQGWQNVDERNIELVIACEEKAP